MAGLTLAGLVLAAGAGARFGSPKALARDADGHPWVVRAVDTLRAGGCAEVIVVLGARADHAARLVPGHARIVVADGWREGVAASLRAGLAAAAATNAEAVVVTPVDTPDAVPAAIERVAGAVTRAGLARATYSGAPGHPVVIGRTHWAAVAASVTGDTGANAYLSARGATPVECGDLWSGIDVDRSGQARPG